MQPNVKRYSRPVCPLAWTAGIDWFRYIINAPSDSRPARERIDEIQQRDRAAGSKLRRWSFEGFRGFASDSIRWGERLGDLLWECSGETAAATMDRMGWSSGHCSRIDLQITWSLSSGQPALGTWLLGSKLATIPRRRSSQTPSGLSVSSTGLWLGTVGRRTSPSYYRLYDKGVELKSAPPGHVWRLELEAKGSHSKAIVCNYPEELKQPTWCAQYLVSRWKSLGCLWPYEQFTDAQLDPAVLPKSAPTASRLAFWLMTSVAPAVRRLLTVFTVAEVLEMLKLSDVAAPIVKDNAQRIAARDAPAQLAFLASERPVHRRDSVRMD